MIHQIDGKLYVEMKINGNSIPDVGNLYNSIVMTEGNGALVPAIQLNLLDQASQLVEEYSLTEANTISMTIGMSGTTLLYTRKYRLFGVRNRNNYNGPTINAVGVLDVPNFYSENCTKNYKGTSDAALSQLASEGGLTYSGPKGGTNDSQPNWLLICKTRAAFMNEIARFGWANPLSFMAAGVTSLNELRYRNITEVFAGAPVATFTHNKPLKDGYTVKESKDMSSAGLSNSWMNSGTKRKEHRLDGTHKFHTSMPVQKHSPYLPVNSEVAGKVNKRSRMDYMLLDVENQHRNYWLAYYQNQRKLALLSERISILVTEVTKVQLFDLVMYRQADSDPDEPVKQTDKYIVVGKSIVVKGGLHYAERIELARYALTMDGKTPLE